MVMPMKTTKAIAFGRVTGGYQHLADESDSEKRHVVPVNWEVNDLPRSAVKQDLLYTLGSALSVFAPTRGNAVARLEALLRTGNDPGAMPFPPSPTSPGPNASGDGDDVDKPETLLDIDEVARDQITTRIAEEFTGHELTTLVTAILAARGFVCIQSPPGADRGIDVVAGRGALGMDSPRVIVQVK
jgi:restriction system protein